MKQEIKSAFSGRGFFLASLLMFLCFLGYTLPGFLYSQDWGPGSPNAFTLVVGSIFFGGVILIFPICATMTYANTQVEEIRTSFVYWKAMRSSVWRISLHKAVASALSGAVATMVPFVIHAILWNLLAVPIDPVAYPSAHELTFAPGVFYNEWYTIHHALPVYVSMSIGMFICGAVWGVIALAVGVWLPDKLMTVTVTTGIYILWVYNFPYLLFKVRFPPPNALFNDGLTPEILVQALISNAVVLVAAMSIYYAGMKRRLQNA